MTRTLRTLAIPLTLVLAGTLGAQSLELRLESEVGEKLPALPIPLRVVAVNNGNAEVTLPWVVVFHASRGGEEKFLGGDSTGWEQRPAASDENPAPEWGGLKLAPGETIHVDFPVRSNCSSFFLNTFLWTPGTYQLRALAAPDSEPLTSAAAVEKPLSDVIANVPNIWVSEPLTIKIREPEGVDAAAWSYLRGQTGNSWLYRGSFVEENILQKLDESYPASQYALCLGTAHTRNLSLSQLETLVARLRAAPQPQFTLEWVELRIAGYHRVQCIAHLESPRNVAAAADECETSYTLLQQLAAKAKNPAVLKAVQSDIASAMRRQNVYEVAVKLDGLERKPATLRPYVVCSKATDTQLDVTFGYENPTGASVTIPIGPDNHFFPAPENRGQPAAFLKGRNLGALRLKITGPRDDPNRAVSWTLNGVTVAPSESDPKCGR